MTEQTEERLRRLIWEVFCEYIRVREVVVERGFTRQRYETYAVEILKEDGSKTKFLIEGPDGSDDDLRKLFHHASRPLHSDGARR